MVITDKLSVFNDSVMVGTALVAVKAEFIKRLIQRLRIHSTVVRDHVEKDGTISYWVEDAVLFKEFADSELYQVEMDSLKEYIEATIERNGGSGGLDLASTDQPNPLRGVQVEAYVELKDVRTYWEEHHGMTKAWFSA